MKELAAKKRLCIAALTRHLGQPFDDGKVRTAFLTSPRRFGIANFSMVSAMPAGVSMKVSFAHELLD